MINNRQVVVLVIEDSPSNMCLISDLLNIHGFEVRQANDEATAMQEIDTHCPDLILMDISLIGANGLILTEKLKRNNKTKDIPIIALSAHAIEQVKEDAFEAGCAGYIVKPINTRTLPKQLLSFLKNN
ncbi:response regulator [Desulfosporosinus sp. PR]|uniref:response regulator n=1 Tax=Candidatus Desulfosporosinus nitrosoreducens TaxID=3401928 RepID=UPI0027EBE20A|nr:response regulator [Desulfosporosinus sp. PR]MDQ7092853.1 response regulator [Desulfosporosinus sp. PR]